MKFSQVGELSHLDYSWIFECYSSNFFSALLKKRGKLYRATKLRNITLTEPALQYFSQKLADDLKQQEAENSTSRSYSVQIQPLGWEKDGLHPLKVIISYHSKLISFRHIRVKLYVHLLKVSSIYNFIRLISFQNYLRSEIAVN